MQQCVTRLQPKVHFHDIILDNLLSLKPWGRWGQSSCHPCCSEHAAGERGCGGPRGNGHYRWWVSIQSRNIPVMLSPTAANDTPGAKVPRVAKAGDMKATAGRECVQRCDQGSSEAHTQRWRSCHTPGERQRTGQSCRGWRKRRSTAASGTSWGQCTRRRRRRQRYHLEIVRMKSSSSSRRRKGCVRMAADSTMLRMVNLLIALSLGVHREQLLQRMGLTWPRPFLFRPLEAC